MHGFGHERAVDMAGTLFGRVLKNYCAGLNLDPLATFCQAPFRMDAHQYAKDAGAGFVASGFSPASSAQHA